MPHADCIRIMGVLLGEPAEASGPVAIPSEIGERGLPDVKAFLE